MIASVIHVTKLRQAEIATSLASGYSINWQSYPLMVSDHQGLQFVLFSIATMLYV